MPPEDDKSDPLSHLESATSPLGNDCVRLHELFESLTEAGFTEKQALYYLASIISTSNMKAPESE